MNVTYVWHSVASLSALERNRFDAQIAKSGDTFRETCSGAAILSGLATDVAERRDQVTDNADASLASPTQPRHPLLPHKQGTASSLGQP